MNESAANQQVVISGKGSIAVRQTPMPRPSEGEVLIDMAYAGICGSDLHTLTRGHPWLPYPIEPGHEASGVVAEVGVDVRGVEVGDAVYVQPAVCCGACFYCLRGKPNLCDNLIGVGSHIPGTMSERFCVPYAAVRPVPTGMSLAAAAMVEPFATVAHAIRLSGGVSGATVAVLGAGSIGQAVLVSALASGAQAVAVTDPVAEKRDRAAELGAVAGIESSVPDLRERMAEALGGRPDVVFDCVASASTLPSAVELAVKGGIVMVVGVGHGPVSFSIEDLQDREVAVIGSAMYHPVDFDRAEELVQLVDAARLVTAVFPVGEAAAAFEQAHSGKQTKIHLTGAAV